LNSIKDGETAKRMLLQSPKPCMVLRVYGSANGKPFVHHHAEGRVPSVTKTTSIEYTWCFIATAAYGDINHPMVQELRVVRDEVLKRSALGRKFIDFYYRHSPAAAAYVSERPALRKAARAILTPIAITSRRTRLAYTGMMAARRRICRLYNNVL
jgi:hypothetical protein